MTAEEKRERLLKRILPCMGITIIYFIFISGTLSEKMTKAEDDYTKLIRRGISTSSIPSVIKQQGQTQIQIDGLEKKHNELKDRLKDLAGFLSNSAPSNESSTLLSNILASNQIRVKNEQREFFPETALSPALKEVWQWLKPTPIKKETTEKISSNIYVQHLSLSSSYQNMYLAMAAIAKGQLKAVPVSFSMKASTDENATADTLDWELLLWM